MSSQPDNNSPAVASDALTQYRLDMIDKTLQAIQKTLADQQAMLQKQGDMKEALGRAFIEIKTQNDRLTTIELEMPTLKLIRGWIIAGVVGCISLLGMTLFKVLTIQ